MFLIDKYRPIEKDDAHFHADILGMFEIMSKDDAIPHLTLYGPDGAGKQTLINICLKMLFGDKVHNTKEVSYTIISSGGKKTIEKVKQSNFHIVINPKGTNYDRYLIHDIVRGYAKSKSFNCVYENVKQFKLVVINNLDELSFCAQAALRRTMERYNDKCRFIMWCKSLSKVITPLQSRCVCIRVPAPQNNEMFTYLFKVAALERKILSLNEITSIVKNANGNIKRALWELQFKLFDYEIDTEYSKSLDRIVALLKEGELKNMDNIRTLLSELTITNYSGVTILRDLVNRLYEQKTINDSVKQQIVQKSAEMEYRLIKGRREIIHLDAFIISTMNFIKNA
jgi:replication factor C subunit 3/5